MSKPSSAKASGESTPQTATEAVIDPELAALPDPSRPGSADIAADPATNNNNDDINGSASSTTPYPYATNVNTLEPLGITQSIAQAPNPRPSDFNYTQITEFPPSTLGDVDYDAIVNDGTPGSPTSKVMKAVVPHNAAQVEPKWPPVSHRSQTSIRPSRWHSCQR